MSPRFHKAASTLSESGGKINISKLHHWTMESSKTGVARHFGKEYRNERLFFVFTAPDFDGFFLQVHDFQYR